MKYKVHKGYVKYHEAEIPLVEIEGEVYVFSRQVADLGGYAQRDTIYRILTQRSHTLKENHHFKIYPAINFQPKDFVSGSPYVTAMLDAVEKVALINAKSIFDVCLYTHKDGVREVARTIKAGTKKWYEMQTEIPPGFAQSRHRLCKMVGAYSPQVRKDAEAYLKHMIEWYGAQQCVDGLRKEFVGLEKWLGTHNLLYENQETQKYLMPGAHPISSLAPLAEEVCEIDALLFAPDEEVDMEDVLREMGISEDPPNVVPEPAKPVVAPQIQAQIQSKISSLDDEIQAADSREDLLRDEVEKARQALSSEQKKTALLREEKSRLKEALDALTR